MGTKVQCKNFLPGYYSMRDLNEDSNSGSWPLFRGDKTLTNGQYYNGFSPTAIADTYHNRDVLKQTMLQHEAMFKWQVYELHRLYGIQRDLMAEIKRKERYKYHIPGETSLSSSPLASQMPSEDPRKWHIPTFTSVNSICSRPSVSGAENSHSPLSFIKGKSQQGGPVSSQNGGSSKDCEVLESRPTKVRRKMLDLQLPADEYIDTEEVEQVGDKNLSDMSSYPPNGCHKIAPESGVKLFLGGGGKTGCQLDASRSDSCLTSRNGLADLNEPIQVEEANPSASDDFLGHAACYREIQGQEPSAKPKSQFLGLPNEILQNSHHGSNNGTHNNLHLENKGNGREWISYMLDAGHSKNNLTSISQGLQPEKLSIPSRPLQAMLNRAQEPPTFFPTDQSKGEMWRERTICGLKISERSHDLSNCNNLEPVVAPHIPSTYPFVPCSDVAKSWSHSVSSWEKQSSGLSQKSISIPTQPCFNSSATLSKSSQSSTQSHGIFGEKWHSNNNSGSNPSSVSDVTNRNGFYHGSSSGSKELPVRFPSTGFDYMNCSNDDSVASEHFINPSSTRYFKGSNCMDMNSAKNMNLNVALLSISSNEAVPQQGIEVIDGDRKHEDHVAVLPWLRARPACRNEATYLSNPDMVELSFSQASSNQLPNKVESGKGPNQNFTRIITSASCARDVDSKEIEKGDCLSTRKILGFPIFEEPHISKNESSSITFPSASFLHPFKGEDTENNGKNRVLDINLPCDPVVPDLGEQIAAEVLIVEKGTDTKVSSFRNHIDLNSCISEDEASLTPSVPSTDVKIAREIDLETPAVPETQEDILPGEESLRKQPEAPVRSPQLKAEYPRDELVKLAAEAIVAISSISSSGRCNQLEDAYCNPSENASCNPSGASLTNSLHWFVEVVFSCADDLESKFGAVFRGKEGEDNEESFSDGIDYFESMTLKLTETNVEEYLSKPAVLENPKVEETGATLFPNRPRKGQARRGRQRRDFQRDILPGLASLSRHEVTEDLQTFGGLMRATGHPWHSGLARRTATRNGSGRGRRRSVVGTTPSMVASPVFTPLMQQLNNIEVGLEDRSLTGWGKTTRRPRRQRCPAGNPPSLHLT
ncbi:hypothetical protein L1049_006775 [Liquidambar formosana]|uniref:Uncharacterized protein n=1 Tax=Liquidambar formosana TaxID=63359 RepID=A0AAP0RG33_LIQFO